MAQRYEAPDWQDYEMEYRKPFQPLESPEQELDAVDGTLQVLRQAGMLDGTEYDQEAFRRHRQAVRDCFDIPWTAISPRMERLIWAINAIHRPACIVAAGVFCGFTFISNAGAGHGFGAVYKPDVSLGIEIRPDEAERAQRNVRALDPGGPARVVAADAVEVVQGMDRGIDLLYLDATSPDEKGKGLYHDILAAAYDAMPTGALVLAHNSVNAAEKLSGYLEFVRDPARFRASVNCVIDPEGLEVSLK